jgi:hypothetical protein
MSSLSSLTLVLVARKKPPGEPLISGERLSNLALRVTLRTEGFLQDRGVLLLS